MISKISAAKRLDSLVLIDFSVEKSKPSEFLEINFLISRKLNSDLRFLFFAISKNERTIARLIS
jgi:hypothetical protein